MSGRLVLLTLCRDEISPRFDMTAEVFVAPLDEPVQDESFQDAPVRDEPVRRKTGRDNAGPGGAARGVAGPGEPGEKAAGRHLVLAHISGEELCDVITRAGVSAVVCGGIEEDYYHYLRWKRVEVICDVMGHKDRVLAKLRAGELCQGASLYGDEA